MLFNSARLLILFRVVYDLRINGVDMERLSYYDFISANPFLMISEDDPAYLDMELIGFNTKTIAYISSSQRYRTKRFNFKQYLAVLLAKGLIHVTNADGKLIFSITEEGKYAEKEIQTMYSIAYRKSAKFVIIKLKNLSDKKLWENASTWLKAKSFQLDLYDWWTK